MIRRVDVTRGEPATWEEHAHGNTPAAFGMGRAVGQEVLLLSVVAGDPDAQGSRVRGVPLHGRSGYHSEARRERLDLWGFGEVVDAVAIEDRGECSVGIVVVQGAVASAIC